MRVHNRARLVRAAAVALAGVALGLMLGKAPRAAAKAGRVLHGDWEKQLKAEHRAIKRLLKAMAETEVGEAARRSALLEQVSEALTRHAVEEENIVYPALSATGAGGEVGDLFDDHAEMKTLIRQLEVMGPEAPEWGTTAKSLKTLVYRHVRQEEQSCFPLLHNQTSDGENEGLTRLVRREAARVV